MDRNFITHISEIWVRLVIYWSCLFYMVFINDKPAGVADMVNDYEPMRQQRWDTVAPVGLKGGKMEVSGRCYHG